MNCVWGRVSDVSCVRYDGDAGMFGNVCVLLSSCEERDSSCMGCHSAPVPCSHRLEPTTTVSTTILTTTHDPRTSALVISGGEPSGSVGNSVVAFVPSLGLHCQLPDLPGGPRWQHTMEGLWVCGGGESINLGRSCLKFNGNQWKSTSINFERS